MANAFIPGELEWVRGHFYEVPQGTAEFCGDMTGLSMLNLGCGEMLSDFGLLNLNVERIVGLDLDEKPPGHFEVVAQKLRNHGIVPPVDYNDRLTYQSYDGKRFPFADGQFDAIFSWSAFEHIRDVPAVLSEMRRVLRDGGFAFVQVYPWFHSFAGSHLSDFIQEPYFQLTRQPEWVRARLEEYVATHPESRDQVLRYMYSEYLSLNHYSADRFYDDVVAAGFSVEKARLISYDLDLSSAPPPVRFSEVMICGTKMLLRKRDQGSAPPEGN